MPRANATMDIARVIALKDLVTPYGKERDSVKLDSFVQQINKCVKLLKTEEAIQLIILSLEGDISDEFAKQDFVDIKSALTWIKNYKKTDVHHCSVLHELIRTKQGTEQTVTEFVDKMMSIYRTEYEREVDEAVITHMIWLNLKPEIAEKISNDNNPRTVEELKSLAVDIERGAKISMPKSSSSIVNVETKKNIQSTSSPQFSSESLWYQNTPPPPLWNERRNNMSDERVMSPQRTNVRFSPNSRNCFVCNKPGHIARNCLSKPMSKN